MSKIIQVLNPASLVGEYNNFKITTNDRDSGELLTVNIKGMKYQQTCFGPVWKWIPYEGVLLELAAVMADLTFVREQEHLHNSTVSTPAGCPLIFAPPLPRFPRLHDSAQRVNRPCPEKFTPFFTWACFHFPPGADVTLMAASVLCLFCL